MTGREVGGLGGEIAAATDVVFVRDAQLLKSRVDATRNNVVNHTLYCIRLLVIK